jgi:hypothetical protein
VHHPKFFLLFERSGSLVVIVSTSNLTPQTAMEGSWVQRFEPEDAGVGIEVGGRGRTDHGMPSDFGVVLADFLEKQSEAASPDGGMLPDMFLRRYVPGLKGGLAALAGRYRFDEAQAHLVSTVPGEHVSGIPTAPFAGNEQGWHRRYDGRPRVAYGPQRVSFVLSRILDPDHIRRARALGAASAGGSRTAGSRMDADTPWLPPSLVRAKDRLVIQPTSLGGNWTRDDLETIVSSYLRPHWDLPRGGGGGDRSADDGPLLLMDIIWPSMDYVETMRSRLHAIRNRNPELADSIAERLTSAKVKKERGEARVMLSSVSFSRLDRSCIARMSLFTHLPNVMPYKSASIHIKSVCRLLRLSENGANSVEGQKVNSDPAYLDSREYLSWFLLTSACLSRGAQGQPTPHRDPASDSMSYSNFELGILFCSRVVGDRVHDRLYVSDPGRIAGCQCGRGERWYKSRLMRKAGDGPSWIECPKKVHLPIPYHLRPRSYQDDPDSDFMSHTPYMHDIPDGTGCVGNMKLTPLGQKISRDAEVERMVNVGVINNAG